MFECAKFYKRRPERGKSVDSFIAALHYLTEHCKHCNYGALRDEMIRDRIIVGLVDANLSIKKKRQQQLPDRLKP